MATSTEPSLLTYVDESGDPSLSPTSSPWFFLSAVTIRKTDFDRVRSYLNEARARLWKNPKHIKTLDWKNLSHPQRGALLPIVTSRPYTQVVVGIWVKRMTRPGKISDPNWLYRWACKLLVERISWVARDAKGFTRILFSETDRLDIDGFRKDIAKELSREKTRMAETFRPMEMRTAPASENEMLYLADNAASSFATGFNPDPLGVTYPHHTFPAIKHLYSPAGYLWKNGFKVQPRVSPEELIAEYPFLNCWF